VEGCVIFRQVGWFRGVGTGGWDGGMGWDGMDGLSDRPGGGRGHILVCTGFPRTLTKTIYISAIFSTLNPILSVANLSRLECAETQFARKPRAYEY